MLFNEYQTIIMENYDINQVETDAKKHFELLKEEGNYFLITDSIENNEGFLDPISFKMTKVLLEIGFDYINTIIAIREDAVNKNSALTNKFYFVLWFVKNNNKMYFDKDPIREKHIWKDVEWGQRSKNYHSKGKDPGNVWIPTEDDGKGNITKHKIMDKEDVLNRCIISTTKEGDNVLLLSDKNISWKFSDINIDFKKTQNPSIREINKNFKKENNIQENKQNNNLNALVHFKTSEEMKEINDNYVDLMVTSPPYWNLKDYFKKDQIGYNESYQDYLDRMQRVLEETYKVLKPEGNMWINIDRRTKNKKPILMPQDITEICMKLGFNLVDIIIWHKSSGIPTHNNNIVRRFEYFLWFSKSDQYKFYQDTLQVVNDYQNNKLNQGNIWNINRKAGSVGKNFIHPAIYPVKLIDRVINLCTEQGDIVLDPFLGSGTSLISAINNNRNFIGYELNEDFHELIQHRFEKDVINESSFNLFNKDLSKEKFKIDYRFHGKEKNAINIHR